MNLLDILKTSLHTLTINKVRTFLTMLGVIIGVYAVVSLVSLGIGMQNYIKDQFEAIGANVIFVVPGKANFAQDPAVSLTNNKLDKSHMDLINRYLSEDIVGISPAIRTGKSVTFKNKSYYAPINGSNYEGFKILNIQLTSGREFNKAEEKGKQKVAVIGPIVAKELFLNVDPIGKKIKIDDKNFEVIGVAKEKGQDFDDSITIPYTTVQDVLGVKSISSFSIKAKNSDAIDDVVFKIKNALRRDLKEDEFSVISSSEILGSIQQVLGMLTAGLGAIAGISLLVGGIGIMNIMLVSVTERTQEIGLRKALGATPLNISIQFLLESTIISILGGSIGLFLGWLTSLAAQTYIRAEVPWWAVLLSFGFSGLVGILFGTYPAVMASKKDAIEALRYE